MSETFKGFSFKENEKQTQLYAVVDTLVFEGPLDELALQAHVDDSGFSHYRLLSDNVLALSENINSAATNNELDPLEQIIGEANPYPLSVLIADDIMTATLVYDKTADSEIPSIDDALDVLNNAGVCVGVSEKRINAFLHNIEQSAPFTQLKALVAKGLAPRKGKDSFIKPLVPNALERILSPQIETGDKANMRNLGEIITVSPEQVLAKRVAPTQGRNGKNVRGLHIPAQSGEYKAILLGDNTRVSPRDPNTVLASIAGQPKFENGIMSVDDTFVTKGVNVGTGNIKYEGAVIVNGDVTENMEIIAKGDVTVNGFVESAFIRSNGDIIITEGATGKMHDEDCRLIARGNIFIQHAQGLDIVCDKNLNIAKQLAYSRVKCKGMVIVGPLDNPNGNLFASNITCYNTIKAGSIGAVSGSAMHFDFSEGYNELIDRLEALHKLFKELSENNANHEIQISAINHRNYPDSLTQKLASLNSELEKERTLLKWLRESIADLELSKTQYFKNALVIANKELFPGVSVTLDKQTWKGDKEYQRSCLALENGAWQLEPII